MDAQEQYKILEGICYIALTVDSKVQFVGIIDGNGKLLVGKHRQNVRNADDEQDFVRIKSSLFYSGLVIPGLITCKKSSKDCIEIVQSDNVKLAIMPLLTETDRYLCIFLHPSACEMWIKAKNELILAYRIKSQGLICVRLHTHHLF
jgi:hypothetical protein